MSLITPILSFFKNIFTKEHREYENIVWQTSDIYFFFAKSSNFGGGEKVFLQIAEIFKGKSVSFLFSHEKPKDDYYYKPKYEKMGKVYSFLWNKMSKKSKETILLSIAKNINENLRPVVFGSASATFYDLIPYLDNHVYTADLIHNFTKRGWEKLYVSISDKITKRVVLGNYHKKAFKELYKENNFPSQLNDRVEIIPNNVNIPKKERKNFELPYQVLYVGRKHKEKRIYLFAEIASICKKLDLPIAFTAIGDLSIHKRKLKKSGITYIPKINDKTILNNYYKNAHFIFLTSSNEGMSMVILEAMSYGMIPLCTNVGDIEDVIDSGTNGFIFPAFDTDEIIVDNYVQQLKKLINNKEEMQKLSDNAYKKIKDEFNPDIFAKKYSRLLEYPKVE